MAKTCSPLIGHLCDNIIAGYTDKVVVKALAKVTKRS